MEAHKHKKKDAVIDILNLIVSERKVTDCILYTSVAKKTKQIVSKEKPTMSSFPIKVALDQTL